MVDHEAVRRAIAAQESLRGTVPDDVIETTLTALRSRLPDDRPDGAGDEPASRSHGGAPRTLDADGPMVGRDAEMDVLEQAFADAAEHEHVRVVNVIGGAGIGKSRLVDEFGDRLGRRPDRPHLLRGRSAPEGRTTPRSVLRSLVARQLEIHDDDTRVEVEAKLRTGLSSLTSREAEIAGQWLGFDLDDSDAVRDLTGNAEFGTIARGHLSAHFRWLLERGPIVLMLDDLHWSDPESLDAVGHVVDTFHDAPVLVVCAARPSLFEHRPRWSAGPTGATVTIELSPLDDDAVRRLVTGLLGRADAVPGELVDLLVDRADGSPLQAEALVELLIDRGVIRTRRRRWEVDPDALDALDRSALPPTVAGVIRSRIDALDDDDLNVLQHASVIGRTFWDDALLTVAASSGSERTHAEIESSLARLRERRLVRPRTWSSFTACREYDFRHALIRDTTADTLPQPDRAPLHRAAASWIERHTGDRLGEHVGLLAEHLSQAGELDRAADLLHEAGARAGATGAVQSALGFYERSLTCRDETGAAHGIAATSTRIELAHLLATAGQNDEAAATYEVAESDAQRTGSQRLAAAAMAGALRTAAARGDWDEAARLMQRAQPLAERFGGEILGRFLSGHALLLIDGPDQDLEAAQRLTERALELWRDLDDPASELRAMNELALVSTRAGRLAEADRWFEAALVLARRVGDTSGEWMLLQNQAVLAHLDARAGHTDFTRVLELYRSSLDRRRRLGLPHVLVLANLAQAEVEAGELDSGRQHAREALRIGWDRHDPLDWTIALVTFAELAFVDGRQADGLTILGAVLARRRTPSLEREIGAVLGFHRVDGAVAEAAFNQSTIGDLAVVVDDLLGDPT